MAIDATEATSLQTDIELEATADDAASASSDSSLLETHTCLPGIVQSFDPATQTAVVQPALQRIIAGVGPVNLPACLDVPVQFQRGGGFVLTLPTNKGDEVILVFSERAIDFWHAHGGVQLPSEWRLHDLSDAFAIPGVTSQPNVLSGFSMDGAELRTLDGTTMFRLENGKAYVGGKLGSQATAMMDTLLPALNAYLAVIAAAAAIGTAADPILGPAALTALTNGTTAWLQIGLQASFKSTKAKVV